MTPKVLNASKKVFASRRKFLPDTVLHDVVTKRFRELRLESLQPNIISQTTKQIHANDTISDSSQQIGIFQSIMTSIMLKVMQLRLFFSIGACAHDVTCHRRLAGVVLKFIERSISLLLNTHCIVLNVNCVLFNYTVFFFGIDHLLLVRYGLVIENN